MLRYIYFFRLIKQAPAILNSIFSLEKQHTIYSYSLSIAFHIAVSHICEASVCCKWRFSRQFFLDLFHSLVKTLTMRDNELKSISSSHSNTHLAVSRSPFHSILEKKRYKILIFWWMCVHNMKYVYRMSLEKRNEENEKMLNSKTRGKKKNLYTPRGDQGNMEWAWNSFHRNLRAFFVRCHIMPWCYIKKMDSLAPSGLFDIL